MNPEPEFEFLELEVVLQIHDELMS